MKQRDLGAGNGVRGKAGGVGGETVGFWGKMGGFGGGKVGF